MMLGRNNEKIWGVLRKQQRINQSGEEVEKESEY